ncbi:MAG: hypothetical protein DWQ09_16085 [Proteobacteria bacterium]|nr:MAG: hypothetical protein DWQ09_16085 [Pseudomonadota bacterium]
MSEAAKSVLVIAQNNKTEALRMASGLTLLDDEVKVAVLGTLDQSHEVQIQLESLDFAEVPISYLEPTEDAVQLAASIQDADVVFVV